ncbi:hypothetical protein A6X21_05075 [Planctopirus hydrillae]|uniref:Uncharacterized protein n=1 Tax=Planctopirus hydrillae TaxID=1841610 RepID=A0A1C3EIU7_9PLAN|nr:hypothetical protein A6X21_05075 [Planctopirus hydrillae]
MFSAAVLQRSTLHADPMIGFREIKLPNYFLEKEKSKTRARGTTRLKLRELIFRGIEYILISKNRFTQERICRVPTSKIPR